MRARNGQRWLKALLADFLGGELRVWHVVSEVGIEPDQRAKLPPPPGGISDGAADFVLLFIVTS